MFAIFARLVMRLLKSLISPFRNVINHISKGKLNYYYPRFNYKKIYNMYFLSIILRFKQTIEILSRINVKTQLPLKFSNGVALSVVFRKLFQDLMKNRKYSNL